MWGFMPAYLLYCMSGLEKPGGAELLEAKNDEEAVRLAHEMKVPVDCEVWDRDRFVAAIPAHEDTV